MLRQISQPKCFPVSLAQARKHLAVDSSDRSNDSLIELLIEAATADSQMKTGRVWVEQDWEWVPDLVSVNYEIDFPIVPVVKAKLYDLTQDSGGDEDNGESGEPENPDVDWARSRSMKKGASREEDSGDTPQYDDVAEQYFTAKYPSADPLGSPLIGSIVPIQNFPEKYQLVLTVGYHVKVQNEVVEQYDNPVLVRDKTGYSNEKMRLVFNRPVQGNIYVSNFEFRVNGEMQNLNEAYFTDGCVELSYDPPKWGNGDEATISFYGGAIYDDFQNFVQPITNAKLPPVQFVQEEFFDLPEPLPTREVYESLAPSPIKNWILTRVGSLYSQRTEIALRAGKSNDAMFPDEFINNLLNPYRVRFL